MGNKPLMSLTADEFFAGCVVAGLILVMVVILGGLLLQACSFGIRAILLKLEMDHLDDYGPRGRPVRSYDDQQQQI